jgi:transposase
MEMRTERIGHFMIMAHRDIRGRVIKTVFLNYVSVAQFHVEDAGERKLAAIELVDRGLCTNRVAGKICGFHRNTVFKLLRTKRLLGVEAVLKDDRGLKEPYKYVNEVRSHIKQILRKYPEWTDQAVAEQGTRDLGMSISRSAVARIRNERKRREGSTAPPKSELIEMSRMALVIDEERFHGRQLGMNFERDPELKRKSAEFSQEPSLQARRETERFLLERLEQGERSSFAGGLMHHMFLQEIGFDELVGVFAANPSATYQSCEILGTLFHSALQGIGSIEALKLINDSELGVLVGCSRSPDKETTRDHLQLLGQQHQSSHLIDEFARRLLKLGQIDEEVFFIDGHFLPYYGLHVIAKGYYTVRRLAMRGNELYAVTDLQGKPLFFITEPNDIDFRPIISRCAEMLKGYGIARPILVFDRGGYGIHFFQDLSATADFVTWAKYLGDKVLDAIPEEAFTVGIGFAGGRYLVAEQRHVVRESMQTAKKEGRSTPACMELRLVVLQDVATGKRLGIYTNNTTRPAYDIGFYMLHRWGDSENFYKEMMARFNLNYHPGYDIRELENQPLVENPDIALTKKAIQLLGKEAKKHEEEILSIEVRLSRRQDKRLVKKLEGLRLELQEKNHDIAQFEEKLRSLPDKVPITELLRGRPLSRSDLEKKKLYDLMQFMAFHSRERLVEVFRDCYDDHRDIKKVVDMITTRGGYLKLVGQTLMVILDWIEYGKHRKAAERLCRLLNEKSIHMVGRLKLKLFFHVSTIPHHGSQAARGDVHILA